MQRYRLDFILHTADEPVQVLHNSLAGFGEGLKIVEIPQETAEKGKSFQISISTHDPTLIFDTCAEFGRIKSVKINEENKNS
jgi:dihydroxyacetone kinase-like predicted kinase